jgi:small-conductance mechanosensitive channel
MNNVGSKENLGRSNSYLKDVRSFSVIVFMVSLISAALLNTQAEMTQTADLIAFFGLGYLVIGIAAQFIRMRNK